VARIGIEIGGLSRWLYGELRGMGLPVTCIDPRHLRGLTKTMPVKTDLERRLAPYPRLTAYYARAPARPAWRHTLSLYAKRLGVEPADIQ
jgi:glutathione S-transferase